MTQALALGFVLSIFLAQFDMVKPWVTLVWFVAWGVAWILSEANTERKLKLSAKWAAEQAAVAIAGMDDDCCRCK